MEPKTMSGLFPEEVVAEILLRLPVKSLVRCTLVSKPWRSLITSPTFISGHLSRTKTQNRSDPVLLLRLYSAADTEEQYSLRLDDDSFNQDQHLDFPFQCSPQNRWFRIVGSCNGLLCLSDDLDTYAGKVILWNPIIRKSVFVPSSSITVVEESSESPTYALGFGFDSRANDYKVVKLSYPQISALGYKDAPLVEIYSLKTGSWRRIDAMPPRGRLIESHRRQAYLHGAVHWIAFSDHFNYSITSFDFANEVFDEILLPETLGQSSPVYFSVTPLGELLSVFRYESFIWNKCAVGVLTPSVSIWVMEEYRIVESWTKRFTVDLQQGLGKTLGMPLGIRSNGDLLLATNTGRLVSYCLEGHQHKDLGICGSLNCCFVDTFVESLVLLDEGEEVVKEEDVVECSKNLDGSREE